MFREIQVLLYEKIDYGDLEKLSVEEIKSKVENIHIKLISNLLNKKND